MIFITLVSFLALLLSSIAEEVCYPPCGCFNDDPPWDGRYLPVDWQELDMYYHLYTRSNRIIPERIEVDSMIIPTQYNRDNPTKFLIHGWLEGDFDLFQETKDTLLDYEPMNVIIVRWDSTNIWYPQNAMDTRLVGACAARLAQEFITEEGASLDKMHCIGMSLGGQSCGFMGKASRDSFAGLMYRVTGLDPAGPSFDFLDDRLHISTGDAGFVDLIHTNGEILGLGADVGDVDFFPNGAGDQPPCIGIEGDLCDHGVARSYFRNSVEYRDVCQFTGNPCNSIEEANLGLCSTCDPATTCSKMGYFADEAPGRGGMYLRTLADMPYCED